MREIEELDTSKIYFTVNNPYYCEAFGVMRGLMLLGYGFLGSVNLDGTNTDSHFYPHGTVPEHNLRWWLEKLKDEILEEEGFEHPFTLISKLEKQKLEREKNEQSTTT